MRAMLPIVLNGLTGLRRKSKYRKCRECRGLSAGRQIPLAPRGFVPAELLRLLGAALKASRYSAMGTGAGSVSCSPPLRVSSRKEPMFMTRVKFAGLSAALLALAAFAVPARAVEESKSAKAYIVLVGISNYAD